MYISYAYVRVSTDKQNVERQYKMIKDFRPNLPQRNIFEDIYTGREGERDGYQTLKSKIDTTLNIFEDTYMDCFIELIVTEIDRLGRSKKQLIEDLNYWYRKGVVVRVLSIPSSLIEVNTLEEKVELLKTNKIIFETYASIAEKELELQKERQRVGIQIAKEKGLYKGRKPIELTDTFINIINKVIKKEMTLTSASKELNVSRQTMYKLIERYLNTHTIEIKEI